MYDFQVRDRKRLAQAHALIEAEREAAESEFYQLTKNRALPLTVEDEALRRYVYRVFWKSACELFNAGLDSVFTDSRKIQHSIDMVLDQTIQDSFHLLLMYGQKLTVTQARAYKLHVDSSIRTWLKATHEWELLAGRLSDLCRYEQEPSAATWSFLGFLRQRRTTIQKPPKLLFEWVGPNRWNPTAESEREEGSPAEVSKDAPTAERYPNRAKWLDAQLVQRAWSKNDLAQYGGPDRKTVQKILDGEPVREDMLEKLADALSQKFGKVSVTEIPRD